MGTPGSPPTRLTVVPDKWVRPTRRPTDLSVGPTDLIDSPYDLLKIFQKIPLDDLIQHDLKTWRTRQDLGGLRLKQIDGIWQDVQCRLRSPGHNRPRVWEPTSSAGQYKADEAIPLVTQPRPIPKQTTLTTGRRVLLSRGPNQYKLVVFSVFRVLVCDL
jgi:hypothetical protein